MLHTHDFCLERIARIAENRNMRQFKLQSNINLICDCSPVGAIEHAPIDTTKMWLLTKLAGFAVITGKTNTTALRIASSAVLIGETSTD